MPSQPTITITILIIIIIVFLTTITYKEKPMMPSQQEITILIKEKLYVEPY